MDHLSPFAAGLSALLVAGALRLAGRWSAGAARLAAPAGLLAGAIVLRLPFNLRAFGAPRVGADHLLLIAVFGGLVALAPARLGGRVRLLALAMLTGWWVAQAPPAAPEFWRVGLAVTLLALLLVRRPPGALLAVALVGSATLWLAGAAPVWQQAALISAGACAATLGAAEASAAAAFLAAAMALASLSSGRVMSGRAGPVEAAALAVVMAAYAWPVAQARLTRLVPHPPPRRGSKHDARVAVRRRKA